MKQLFNVGLVTAGIVIFAACGGASENKTGDDHSGHDHSKMEHSADDHSKMDNSKHDHSKMDQDGHDYSKMDNNGVTSGVVKIKDDKINAVYQHYVHLTTALINGDAAEAKIAANAIEAGAKEIQGASTVATASSKIVNTADVEQQRVIYSTLSNDFIALVKKAGISGGELYVDYCPMALNDKGGYWLSSQKEIRNPYFGDKMMKCGEVKETIK